MPSSHGPTSRNICWHTHTREIKQFKAFRGTLEGMKEVELILWSGWGSVLGDIICRQARQAGSRATEGSGCETGFADSSLEGRCCDICLLVVCHSLSHGAGTSCAFPVVASYTTGVI